MSEKAVVHKGFVLTGATAQNTAGLICSAGAGSQMRNMKVLANFKAGSSAGVITVEEAPDENFTGTWSSLGTITWAGAANKIIGLALIGPFMAVRARVSTAVDGNGADVHAVGN